MKPDKNPLPAADKTQETAPAKKDEALTRRLLFGGSLVGLVSMIGQACSGSDFAGISGGRKKKAEENGGNGGDECDDPELSEGERRQCRIDRGDTDAGDVGDVDAEGDSGGGGLGDGQDSSGCHANTNAQIDLSGHPEAPDDLKPRVVFYGRDGSAMMALKFNSDKDIGQVIISKPDGKLLALHGISGADKDKDGKYRPIIIDNLNLTGVTKLKVVLQLGSDRYATEIEKTWFDEYNGSEVVDLGGGTVPAGMMDNQSMTRFTEGPNFDTDTSKTYPSDSGQGARNLRTVMANSTWTPGNTIKGTVTDIMGDTIDIGGANLIEYQTFCTYVVSGGKAYRTILQVA